VTDSAISTPLRKAILRDRTLDDAQEEFTAVLGDFDHTVKMDRREGEHSSHRTVSILIMDGIHLIDNARRTLPFLATHLLTTIEKEIPRHSPVHDLESCLWVSVWVAVHIILDRTKNEQLQTEDERVLGKLLPEHSDVDDVASAKESLLSHMDMHLSKNFTPFRTILSELASIANTYYKQSVAKHGKVSSSRRSR
jgi:hypothetical protein